MTRFLLYATPMLVFSVFTYGQQVKDPSVNKVISGEVGSPYKSSPAHAELLLKRTELQSELESLVLEYTEEFPKVVQIRYSLTVLQKESERIRAVKPAEASKLTLALGKLMVRKIELETDLWELLKNYKDEHPDVKRAKRKVEIYEAAIKEILG